MQHATEMEFSFNAIKCNKILHLINTTQRRSHCSMGYCRVQGESVALRRVAKEFNASADAGQMCSKPAYAVSTWWKAFATLQIGWSATAAAMSMVLKVGAATPALTARFSVAAMSHLLFGAMTYCGKPRRAVVPICSFQGDLKIDRLKMPIKMQPSKFSINQSQL